MQCKEIGLMKIFVVNYDYVSYEIYDYADISK